MEQKFVMKVQWHRLFGLMLMDYLSNRGFRVELEKDLSVKRQPLDVVIVEQENGEPVVCGQHSSSEKGSFPVWSDKSKARGA